jgi:hypothetical protein
MMRVGRGRKADGGVSRFGIGHDDVAIQAAAWRPATLDGDAAWFDDGEEVVHDPVGDRFVKNALVTKSLQIHLQAFQFDAYAVGHVGEYDRAVVGLARFGTHRSKLRAMMFDGKIAAWAGVVKDLQ